MRRYLAWQRSPAGHIYMEARIFTPDSRRLILRSLPHGRSSRYLLCDLADGGSLRSIVDEPGAIKTHPHWLELLGFERFQHN